MRVGILGGSFDPIHHAHLIIAQLARESLGLDVVRLVIAARQPLKPGDGATAEQRAEMVELAVAGVPGLVADWRELRREGPSWTVDTLRELRSEHPGDELTLLLGSDSARRFGEWREPEAIRALARVVVFRRGGEAAPTGFDAEVAVPALELSSTAIRTRAAAGLSLAGWVPDRVADYISRFGLYVTGSGTG
jgi:nicotinate-nucleotide adenylyltransferase